MPHNATGERRAWRHDDRFDGIDDGDARQLPDAVSREVGFGKDRHHSADSACSFQIQPGNVCECKGRAEHMGMQHAGHVFIGDISPASGQETLILEPIQGLTLITLPQALAFLMGRLFRIQRQAGRVGQEGLQYPVRLDGLKGKVIRHTCPPKSLVGVTEFEPAIPVSGTLPPVGKYQ
jgi:hypothetical protein